MAIFPVILCGGAGTRLWPVSRSAHPKPFIALTGELSLFQETVRRLTPLHRGAGELIVVTEARHLALAAKQLAQLGLGATLVLEPEGRDSAPAMAAAAALILRRDAEGVALFVASDHHIPDDQAFRTALLEGAKAAAAERIVTFGVRPTEPSTAYGYIQPAGPGLAPVERFIEKPGRAEAQICFDTGCLWNSGNVVVRASVLRSELTVYAPEIVRAVDQALGEPDRFGIVRLSDAFRSAPRISIDYAVMERSRRVSVLPVEFGWSDLGAWDALEALGSGNRGLWLAHRGERCLIRAADGMVVATTGVSNLAVIAERDAVLVCSLDCAQDVKGLVERLKDLSPQHAQAGATVDGGSGGAGQAFSRWIMLSALPVWGTLGVDDDGGFRESLDASGRSLADFRRARVQTRQAYVYSTAGALGWNGPWRELVAAGLKRFEETNLRTDGLYRTRVSRAGAPLDETASLYDQAFALLAFAAAAQAGIEPGGMALRARRLAGALTLLRVEGGWREAGDHPYQANAHMHLLEAFLAWEMIEPDGAWRGLADEIVALARRAFIDPTGGFLREFFNAAWAPAPGEDGRLVEPGHQFEWAWLLTRWGRLRNDAWAKGAARRLYAVGRLGVDSARGVAIDELDQDLTIRSARARLWPQTERLKAALILAETAEGLDQQGLLEDVRKALDGLRLYLEPNGLWRDKMEVSGRFVEEPAPASSFYHIMAAWQQLRLTAGVIPDAGLDDI